MRVAPQSIKCTLLLRARVSSFVAALTRPSAAATKPAGRLRRLASLSSASSSGSAVAAEDDEDGSAAASGLLPHPGGAHWSRHQRRPLDDATLVAIAGAGGRLTGPMHVPQPLLSSTFQVYSQLQPNADHHHHHRQVDRVLRFSCPLHHLYHFSHGLQLQSLWIFPTAAVSSQGAMQLRA